MPQRGDDWRSWLDCHGAALVLFARQFVATHADAEDIVQEAFVRFWQSESNVADPVSYMFGCVKHCALDFRRGRRRRVRREQLASRPDMAPAFVAPDDQDERQAAIEMALRELPIDQAEVVVLKIWARLTFPQIAAALDISPNTAASRYRYALAKLREALAEESIL